MIISHSVFLFSYLFLFYILYVIHVFGAIEISFVYQSVWFDCYVCVFVSLFHACIVFCLFVLCVYHVFV